MATKKYGISYCLLTSYFVTVFLISVVIAVVVSLVGVKRTNCDENPNKIFEREVDVLNNVKGRRHHIQRNLDFKSNSDNRVDPPGCDALFTTNVGNTLWNNSRLPTNVIPTRYAIQLSSLNLTDAKYSGHIDITLDLAEDVNTIIVHAHLIGISSPTLQDNANSNLNIECAAFYTDNEYYVIRTTNLIRRAQAPLKLSLNFNGFLDLYQSGLFEIHYSQADEFNGYIKNLNFLNSSFT